MNIALGIVILYIILLYLLSWYATKLSQGGYIGYLLAGRGFGTTIVATMIAGLAIGGASTIGVAESAYQSGLAAGWYNAAWGVGAVVAGLLVAGRLRDFETTSLPEIFERYFDTSGRIIGVFGQIIIQMVITSLQYVAGGAILAALMPGYFDFNSGMLLSAAVFIGITMVGGYWAAGLSNIFNVIVIYLGVVIGAVLVVDNAGGIGNMLAALPASHPGFDLFAGLPMAMIIAWFAVMLTQTQSIQAIAQVAFAAKDARVAKRGFILGGLIIFPAGFICAIFGIAAAAMFPGITPALALPKTLLALNPWAAGLALSGLWAADVSTAVGLLLGSSTLVVNDIYKRFVNPDLPEKKQLLISRLTVLAISVFTYWMATSAGGIIKTLLIGLTLTTSYTVLLLGMMYLPGMCKKGTAFWTLFTGIAFLALWQFVPAIRVVSHPIYLAWPLAIATFLAVYFLDPRPARLKAAA